MNTSTILTSLTIGLALAASATVGAQSGERAYSNVVRGCTAPGPERSLVPVHTDPPLVQPGPRGIFTIEAESSRLVGDWVLETRHAGFAGRGYIRWNGPNLYSQPGRGILQYRMEADQAGRYRFALHNRHEHSDPSLENDCWIRVNGGTWWKLYSNDGRNSRVWNWHSRLDPGHGYADFDFRAGENLVELSGRSFGFMIDRIHAFPTSTSNPFDLSLYEQIRWERPRIGTMFGVRVGDPDGQAGLRGGACQALLMIAHRPAANAPCGRLIPQLGMRPGTPGEMMLGEDPLPYVVPAAVSFHANEFGVFPLPIPNDPGLIGTRAFAQGLLFDGVRGVLTDRLDMVFGDI